MEQMILDNLIAAQLFKKFLEQKDMVKVIGAVLQLLVAILHRNYFHINIYRI
jgi:hypothetical protein